MEHRANWPIRQDGSGMGDCQVGQTLCACALTWRLRFQQEPFAHGKPVEPCWQPCAFRCYLGWTCLLSIWEVFLKQGILIYVHARMQSCKLYLNKHAKDTDVMVFRLTRSPQACMNIFIYSYLRLQDILDDQGHPFGIKKKLRQR